jgi:nitrate reductase gamma subunit
MDDWIGGRLVSIAFVIFILGLLYQGRQFFKLTRKKEWIFPPLTGDTLRQGVPAVEKLPSITVAQSIMAGLASLKGILWKTDPLMMIVTSVFHLCLILAPVFLLGHNILLDQSWGLSLWSLHESLADGLTMAVLICVLFFMMRRLFLARVRAITSFYDYVVLLIAAGPFLTGFLAYHQWFDYHTVMILHILAAELMLITIPFTKLGHMLFFFLYRFLIGSEYSFTRGSRTW